MEFTPDSVKISQSVILTTLLHSNRRNSTSVRLILSGVFSLIHRIGSQDLSKRHNFIDLGWQWGLIREQEYKHVVVSCYVAYAQITQIYIKPRNTEQVLDWVYWLNDVSSQYISPKWLSLMQRKTYWRHSLINKRLHFLTRTATERKREKEKWVERAKDRNGYRGTDRWIDKWIEGMRIMVTQKYRQRETKSRKARSDTCLPKSGTGGQVW